MSASVDPWTLLRADVPLVKPPRHLAYVDGDSLGFDVRMALPARCFTCGTDSDLRRSPLRFRASASVLTVVAQALRGESAGSVVRSGQALQVDIPTCGGCDRIRRRLAVRRWLVRLSPLWGVAVLAPVVMISEPLTLAALGLGLVGLAVVGIRNAVQRARYLLVIERLDSDGILRLRPVHPDASEAVLTAAGMNP